MGGRKRQNKTKINCWAKGETNSQTIIKENRGDNGSSAACCHFIDEGPVFSLIARAWSERPRRDKTEKGS